MWRSGVSIESLKPWPARDSPPPPPPAPRAVRAVLSERGDNPALAASTARELQQVLAQEQDQGASSPFRGIMQALARPTRIVRGKEVSASWQVRLGVCLGGGGGWCA